MRLTAVVVGLSMMAACGGGGQSQSTDSPTQRQRDSAVGASRLPGAGGVQRALEASDTAAARRALLDSLSRK